MRFRPAITLTHTMAWLIVASLVVYLILALLISGSALQTISTSLILGISVTVTYTWGFYAVYAMKREAIGKNQLAIAIFTLSAIFVLSQLYTVVYVVLGQPMWWPNDTILGLFGYMFAMALALFVAAPVNVEKPEPLYYRRLIIGCVLGILAMSLSYIAQMTGLLN